MRAAELSNPKSRPLAGRRRGRITRNRRRAHRQLAGFEAITTGRFSGDHRGSLVDVHGYLPYCEIALRAIRVARGLETMRASFSYGQVLHWQLAYRPAGATKKAGKQPGISLQVDATTLSVIAHDLAMTLQAAWNTLEPARFNQAAIRGRLETVVVGPIARDTISAMDSSIRTEQPLHYLGTATLDLGNPVHRELFGAKLLKDGYVGDGKLYVRQIGDEQKPNLAWSAESAKLDYEIVSRSRFELLLGESEKPLLSAHGAQSLAKLRHAGQRTPQQQIASALFAKAETDEALRAAFDYSTDPPPGFEALLIPDDKLAGYALNEQHPTGKDKAKAFQGALAIGHTDADFLKQQIIVKLRHATFHKVRSSEYGIQWHADLEITGRNGAARLVRTAWITRTRAPARLTSVYVLESKKQPDNVRVDPRIVNLSPDDERWPQSVLRLAVLAAVLAAQSAVPVPMFLEGGYVISERYGAALVVLQDGRSRFARLVRRKGLATTFQRRTAVDVPRSLDLGRAAAWAAALADVLQLNGLSASVVTIPL